MSKLGKKLIAAAKERGMRDLTPLCLLAKKHSTDKGGRHLTYDGDYCEGTHEYTPVYWDLFGRRREKVKSVLEIGINRGCSLDMWEEFFPNADIIGLDIDPATLINRGRIKSFYADAGNDHSLRNAIQQVAPILPFDLIIDDGSHSVDHQIAAIKLLPEFLSEDGVLVIEDLSHHGQPAGTIGMHTPEGFFWKEITCEPGVGRANRPESLIIVQRIPVEA